MQLVAEQQPPRLADPVVVGRRVVPGVGGGHAVVSRLPTCRATYNGYQTWDVIAHYRFDGGEVHDASVTTSLSDYERIAGAARIALPAGARSLEMWFENTDRTGCDTWDSRYGANYVFSL